MAGLRSMTALPGDRYGRAGLPWWSAGRRGGALYWAPPKAYDAAHLLERDGSLWARDKQDPVRLLVGRPRAMTIALPH